MDLAESTRTGAADASTRVSVLPVGSTEQHGPHAPLGTDWLSADAVARAGVKRYPGEAVIAPVIPIGIAAEHRQFAGTLWVTDDTFRAYVRETIESLASHGWDRIVVVNGHGGNVPALREICGQVTRDETAYAVQFTWFDAVDIDDVALPTETSMGHGGSVETSLLRHLRPDLVDETAFEQAREGGTGDWGEWQSGVNLTYDSAEFTESGVVGDPGKSSAAVGEQLLDAAADSLGELLEVVANRDGSVPKHR